MLLGNYTSISQNNGLLFRLPVLRLRVLRPGQLEGEQELHLRVSAFAGASYGPTYTLGEFLQNYFDPRLYDPGPGGSDRHHVHRSARSGSIVPNSGNPFNGLIEEGQPEFRKASPSTGTTTGLRALVSPGIRSATARPRSAAAAASSTSASGRTTPTSTVRAIRR